MTSFFCDHNKQGRTSAKISNRDKCQYVTNRDKYQRLQKKQKKDKKQERTSCPITKMHICYCLVLPCYSLVT